jgi:glycosyltransferase 2 family protein
VTVLGFTRRGSVRAGLGAAWRSPAIRLFTGLGISALFAAVTLSRVDLEATCAALGSASLAGVAIAVTLVVVELAIRAARWRYLLAPVGQVTPRSSFVYLSIGYFANTLLPARLGDGARAYLAGRSIGVPSLAVLGSIVVERVFDAAAILVVVLVTGALTTRGSEIAGGAAIIAAIVVLGLLVITVGAVAAIRSGLLRRGQARLVQDLALRIAEGGRALTSPRGIATVIAMTFIPFGVAVCTFGAVATSLGLPLAPVEWALVLGVLALSTALPAAPGSIGTYEFVGVTALGALGIDPSHALAASVLIHVVATLPPAVIGLLATLAMHLRIEDLRVAAPPPAGVGAGA